jgi:hypothetical protein
VPPEEMEPPADESAEDAELAALMGGPQSPAGGTRPSTRRFIQAGRGLRKSFAEPALHGQTSVGKGVPLVHSFVIRWAMLSSEDCCSRILVS